MRLNLWISLKTRFLRSLDLSLELCHAPPGPAASDRVGRPPVLPVVLCAVGLRAGALHQRFLWQRGIPGRCEDSRTGWSHLQGLPHPGPPPQRAQSLRQLPEVSWAAARRAHARTHAERTAAAVWNMTSLSSSSGTPSVRKSCVVVATAWGWRCVSGCLSTLRMPVPCGLCLPVNTALFCERDPVKIWDPFLVCFAVESFWLFWFHLYFAEFVAFFFFAVV